MRPPIFTEYADTIDLNDFDLDALQDEGVETRNAGHGNDRVILSETQNLGEDFYAGNGRDVVFGSSYGDKIYGGLGKDELYGLDGDDYLSGGNDTDWLYGGKGADTLHGNADRDFLYGEDGNDALFGGDGGDFLYGGDGADVLSGGDGWDFLFGGAGADLLNGNTGDDLLAGSGGADTLFGGRGADVFLFQAADLDGSADLVADFERGIDLLRFEGILGAGGVALSGFADLDTNSDGVLNAFDFSVHVGVGEPQLTLELGGGSVVFRGLEELDANDFEILAPSLLA